MRSLISKTIKALMLVPVLALGVSVVVPANVTYAACSESDLSLGSGVDCAQGTDQKGTSLFGGDDSIFKTVTNILLFLVGAVSVIMLIIGGIRYVVSAGDQSAVTGAKNTILYAIVGIVIAFLSYAAVQFVTARLADSSTGTPAIAN